MERFEDPDDVLNSPAYHTGKPCIEPGCDRPAGTHWSHLWCQPCNAERMRRITSTLHDIVSSIDARTTAQTKPKH